MAGAHRPLGKGEARLSASAAAELGLRAGTPVAQGGIDAYLGMIGMGAVEPGDMAMIMGSSTCHLANSAAPLLGSGMSGCYPDAIAEGTYTLEGGQTATGSILDWYRRHFAGNETAEAAKTGRHVYEVLDAKASAVPPGCDGLVCLDYWQGNRCPLKDPRGRGVFWGLTLGGSRFTTAATPARRARGGRKCTQERAVGRKLGGPLSLQYRRGCRSHTRKRSCLVSDPCCRPDAGIALQERRS